MDIDDIVSRLERVASWHTGRQQHFVKAIITDLTGKATEPLVPASGSSVPLTNQAPGEGSEGLDPSAPPV